MNCATGSKCAASYANISMANFEEKHIYLYAKEIPLL